MKFSPNELNFLNYLYQVIYEYKPRLTQNHVCTFARIFSDAISRVTWWVKE